MRAAAIGLAAAAVVAGSLVADPARALTAEQLSGSWSGEYTCAQGRTGVTFTLRAWEGGEVEGLMSFHSPGDGAKGVYVVEGSFTDNGVVTLVGAEWRERPGEYVMADFKGRVSGTRYMSGEVTGPGCTSFNARRD